MSRNIVISLGLLSLLALSFFCFSTQRPIIEKELSTNTNEVLKNNGYTWATATADGQRIELTGMAPSDAARNEAANLAREVYGVTDVDNRLLLSSFKKKDSTPNPSQDVAASNTESKNGIQMPADEPVASPPGVTEPAETEVKREPAEQTSGTMTPHEKKETEEIVETAEIAIKEAPAEQASDTMTPPEKKEAETDKKEAEEIVEKEVINKDNEAPEQPPAPPSDIEANKQTEQQIKAEKALACQNLFDALLNKQTIQFKSGSAILTRSSSSILDELTTIIQSCPAYTITIAGHTDSSGPAPLNQLLSEQRAASVKNALISRGVNATSLSTLGYGETQPIADNHSPEGMRKNRRIAFKVQEN